MINRCALFLTISVSFIPAAAQAGAWLQKEGDGQVITTLRIYTTDRYFDSEGEKSKILPFSKTEVAPYFEYGLSDKVTLGGEVDFASANSHSPRFDDITSSQFGYGTLFARSYLLKGSDYVLSIEPGVTFPASLGADLTSDGDHPIPELKLDFGYSFKHRGLDHFVDLSMKYRYRGLGPNLNDMLKTEATLGYRLTSDIMALAQVSDEQTLGNPDGLGNYNLVKPEISVLYDYSSDFSHQLGAFSNIYGQNTGAGYGFAYSLWYKF